MDAICSEFNIDAKVFVPPKRENCTLIAIQTLNFLAN